MSQIAAALARSKGKKVDPVPSTESAVPAIHSFTPPMPAPAAPAAPAKRKLSPLVIGLASLGVIALAVGLYFVFRPAPEPPALTPKPKAKAVVAPPAPKVAPVVAPVAKPAPLPDPALTASYGLGPELEQNLKALVISARRTGSEQRIVIGGKVYAPGDEILPGAFLDSVHADKIVFRDAAKNTFERR